MREGNCIVSIRVVLGPSPLPGTLKGLLSLVIDTPGGLPRLMVSCVEGSWVGEYADLGGFGPQSEPLGDWEIYVCARAHNRPVASAVFSSGLFDLTGRCTGKGQADAFIWRLRPALLDPEARAQVARETGWRHAPAHSAASPGMRASASPGWGVSNLPSADQASSGDSMSDDFAGIPRFRLCAA
jgi:hypothetical protein